MRGTARRQWRSTKRGGRARDHEPCDARAGYRARVSRRGSAIDRGPLLERDQELALLDGLIEEAAAGQARFALIERPAGIGKTQLVAEARRRAAEQGFAVLAAQGGELERHFPFGVVRQLFEPEVVEDEARALAGAAGPARPVFEPAVGGEAGEPVADPSFASLHGLYWLTLNLSEHGPLLLAVDDLQWCDPPSLRFLAYLKRRLEGLPVLVLCGLRSAQLDAGETLVGEIAGDPLATVIRPHPLSEPAVADLVRGRLPFLGSNNAKLGADPRARYASQPLDRAGWDRIAEQVGGVEYADVPPARREKFTQEQFLAARRQLVRELGWVGNVRGYLQQLKSPIANTGAISYANVVDIGDRIYKDIERPEGGGAFSFLELVEILLELAGPGSHEVSATVAGVMQLGVLGFEAGENGAPAREVQFRARELGSKITNEMQSTARTYDAIGDVIVTDPEKLAFVGENGDCEPTEDGCPKGYSFTDKDVRRVYADVYRGIERLAYEELVPLAYATYALNPERLNRAPEAKWYRCTEFSPLFPSYPWWYYSDVAQAKATTAERLEVDPESPSNDLWRLLVLSRPRQRLETRGTAPSDAILERMFERVPSSDNPREGGLGISAAGMMRKAEWRTWAPTEYDPTYDLCR
jgi:hypothetical protein